MTTTPSSHTLDQVADGLRARIHELCIAWGLQGRVENGEFVALNPLRHDHAAGSFRVILRGRLQGMVKEFASGEAWTPLQFTAALWFGGGRAGMAKAIQWGAGWLGIDGTDPAALRKTKRALAERPDDDDEAAIALAAKKRDAALAIWLTAQPLAPGDPVWRYLAGRAIDLGRLPFALRGLRHHPGLWNGESRRAWPAMVAPIVGMTGAMLGVHRTWLETRAGMAGVRKAPLATPKMTLGPYRGGVIRIWNGIRIDPEAGEIRPGLRLSQCREPVTVTMAEGIEDALTPVPDLPELRVVAGVAIANMAALEFPPIVGTVQLLAQNDAPGSAAAEKGFPKIVANLRARGKRVLIVRPPEGVKDINDLAREEAA